MMGGPAQPAAAHRPRQQPSSHPNGSKQFPTKLTQIKEFPVERSNQPAYKLQKALIDQKIVPCINVRPYVFHDLMMTLPDFVKHFFPDLPIEKAREMLQEIMTYMPQIKYMFSNLATTEPASKRQKI